MLWFDSVHFRAHFYQVNHVEVTNSYYIPRSKFLIICDISRVFRHSQFFMKFAVLSKQFCVLMNLFIFKPFHCSMTSQSEFFDKTFLMFMSKFLWQIFLMPITAQKYIFLGFKITYSRSNSKSGKNRCYILSQ